MGAMLSLIADIGEISMIITPLTLVVGLINAIKRPKEEARWFAIMAIISAYLIIVPLIHNSIY